MSIFSKETDQIETPDLQELLAESAVENIRLEFKLQDPAKDEALKKLTSFANTFGGYLLIGAQDDGRGRLLALPGIEPVNGLKQRLIQWGYDGAWPPLLLFVSDPIASPQDATKVCYVVFVPESEEAPHFINGRKGVYIRTDEFSQRFEPQLATYDEIQHLANRRAITVTRRDSIIQRAANRFTTYGRANSFSGATLALSVCPSFPSKPLVSHGKLLKLLKACYVPWRQDQFPQSSIPVSQHESAIILKADYGHSLLEANVWGLLFYAYDLLDRLYPDREPSGIHLYSLLGHILVILEHAKIVYSKLGFEGTLLFRTTLDRIRGVPVLSPSYYNQLTPRGGSPLDDHVEFDTAATSGRLKIERDVIAVEILRSLMFALNHADLAANEDVMGKLLEDGYKYNFW